MQTIKGHITHNMRSPEQWRIIKENGINFAGKKVMDLGCGWGDILLNCWADGASTLVGVEYDPDNKRYLDDKISKYLSANPHIKGTIETLSTNIDDIDLSDNPPDIAICFSILPYLDDYLDLLDKLYEDVAITLIECQYGGDGPGIMHIKNDADMKAILQGIGWSKVEAIGKTLVVGRNKYRTIWKCTN